MARYFLVSLFICVTTLQVRAQTFVTHFSDSLPCVALSVETRDSNIFVAGYTTDTSVFNGFKTYSSKLYLQDNLIASISMRPPHSPQYNALRENAAICTSDNGVAMSYVLNDSLKELIVFTKFDSIGNASFGKTYDPIIQDYRHVWPINVIELNGNNYYIRGIIQTNDYLMHDFLIKTDENGNSIFFKICTEVSGNKHGH